MNLRDDFNFDNKDVAFLMTSEEIRHLDSIFNRIPISWKWLEGSKDPSNFLYVRMGLLSYMGAAYALKEKDLFVKCKNYYFEYQIHKSNSDQLKPELSYVDLYLSCALNKHENTQSIINLYFSNNIISDTASGEELVVDIITRLLNNDNEGVLLLANTLLDNCHKKSYFRKETEYYELVANSALSLIQKSEKKFNEIMIKIDEFNFQYINKEINKCKKGLASDLHCSEYFDSVAASLLTIAINRNLVSNPIKPYRFFDLDWMQ